MVDDSLTEPDSDKRIAALARELAAAINVGHDRGRGSLRDYAIDVLRETVDEDVPVELTGAAAAIAPLNPVALGVPMLLVAAPLLAFFPPIGLLLLIGGLVACGLGIGMSITAARARRAASGEPEKS